MLLSVFQLRLQGHQVLVQISHICIFGLAVAGQGVPLILQGLNLDLELRDLDVEPNHDLVSRRHSLISSRPRILRGASFGVLKASPLESLIV